ncbi:glycosyltransferase [Agromyces sp. ISL-38]|uniref:glycosyltransferase n=1 Tax=Agromyces sp. ISL-38 TaxID=2819107 RepID=UPI001BE84265|nr:glycosyltransferase [Agromyces sp. ISL-38]MBT2500324.1 glycosyltransferase [Agromyces sp. ISL-38]
MPSTRPPRESSPDSAAAVRVIAVVPTYHPDASVVQRLLALADQVDQVVVVDDGSGPSADEHLERVAAEGIVVERLERNSGIAAALNTGVRRALADGADYVVNVDQDTDLPPGYVATALSLFAKSNAVTRLGIVCVDAVNGAPALPTWVSPEGFGLVPEAIQTGFVISRECLETAGLFDERLVIDCVDTEYCLRVRDSGFRIAVAKGTDIRHSIGRRAELRPFGVPLRHASGGIATYQYHSPFRRYYIARNNIDLMLRNVRKRPRWVLTVLKREMGGMIISMVSGPQRIAQVLAIGTGTLHGLARRRGMIPDWLRRLVT